MLAGPIDPDRDMPGTPANKEIILAIPGTSAYISFEQTTDI
jgi:hypothetical protein